MKYKKLSLIIGLILVFILLLAFTFWNVFSIPINTDFSDAIILTFDGHNVEINQDDIPALKEAFNGRAWKDIFGFPACPFGEVSVTFSSSDYILTLYPAGDDCDTVRVGHSNQNYYYNLGGKNEIMRGILERHGVSWPYA